VAGEPLELEEALGGERVAREELGELVHLARAERDVDERELREHLLLHRLRPAAADTDDPLRVLALEPLRLAEVGDEPVVSLLADRARVEQDEISVAAPVRLAVAERLEHALHALRVVLVHLAAERGDVVALHRPAAGYPGSLVPTGNDARFRRSRWATSRTPRPAIRGSPSP
jgi:hypothetical protein